MGAVKRRVPFVLRPVANGKNFELLGECYVHGVMDGPLFSAGVREHISGLNFAEIILLDS